MTSSFNISTLQAPSKVSLHLFEKKNAARELDKSVLECWHEAGFCSPNGRLYFDIGNEIRPLSVEATKRFDALMQNSVQIGEESYALKDYFEELFHALSHFAPALYLRGSYAAYVVDPKSHLKHLVDQFCSCYPPKKNLMEQGWEQLEREILPHSVPHDADFALIMQIDDPQRVVRLVTDVHRRLASDPESKLKALFLKAPFQPVDNDWSHLSDPIVMCTLQGSIKVDILFGHPQEAPYLFTYDNHYLCWDQFPFHTVLKGSLNQSCLDHATQRIRSEKRHEKDFHALLKAVYHQTLGRTWDEEEIRFKDVFQHFKDNDSIIMTAKVKHKIVESEAEPVSFVFSFLNLVDDLSFRDLLWEGLRHLVTPCVDMSFEEALRQCSVVKGLFPELMGVLPSSSHPVSLSIPHLMRFVQSNPQAHILERLLVTDSFSEELLTCWLDQQEEVAWSVKFERLLYIQGIQRIHHRLRSHFEKIPQKDLFIAAFEKRLFFPDERSKARYQELFGHYRGEVLVQFLQHLGTKIDLPHKGWIVNLWMDAFEDGRIDRSEMQRRIEGWLESRISAEIKREVCRRVVNTMGLDAFTLKARESATAHLNDLKQEDLEEWFLKCLEEGKTSAERFLLLYRAKLEDTLDSLFQSAFARGLHKTFIRVFANDEHLLSQFIAILSRIPKETRFKCVSLLPNKVWLQVAGMPGLLSPDEKQKLLIDWLRVARDPYLMWAIQRLGIQIPERLFQAVMQGLKDTHHPKGENVEKALQEIEENFEWEHFLLLHPKLDAPLRSQSVQRMRNRVDLAFASGQFPVMQAYLNSEEIRKVIPVESDWLTQCDLQKASNEEILKFVKGQKLVEEWNPLWIFLCDHLMKQHLEPSHRRDLGFVLLHLPLLPRYQDYLIEELVAYPLDYQALHSEKIPSFIRRSTLSHFQMHSLYQAIHRSGLPLPEPIPQSYLQALQKEPPESVDPPFVLAVAKTKGGRLHWISLIQSLLNRGFEIPLKEFLQICRAEIKHDQWALLIELFQNSDAALFALLQEFVLRKTSAMNGLLDILLKKCLQSKDVYPYFFFRELIEKHLKDLESVHEFTQKAVNAYLSGECIPYQWLKYASTYEQVLEALLRFDALELNVKTDSDAMKVALKLINRVFEAVTIEPQRQLSSPYAKCLVKMAKVAPQHPRVLHLMDHLTRDVNEDVDLAINVHLHLACHGDEVRGLEAYQVTMKLIAESQTFDLIRFESITHLNFRYPKVSINGLAIALSNVPLDRLSQHRVRISMITNLCSLHPERVHLTSILSRRGYVLELCESAKKDGSVDLTKSPYCDVIFKELAEISLIDLEAFTKVYNAWLAACVANVYKGNAIQAFAPLMRLLIDKLFEKTSEEQLSATMNKVQHVLKLPPSHPMGKERTMCEIVSYYLERLNATPWYKPSVQRTLFLEYPLFLIRSGVDTLYWTLILQIQHVNSMGLVSKMRGHINNEMSLEVIERALNRAFELPVLRVKATLIFVVKRAFSHPQFIESKRKAFFKRLVPFLVGIGEDPQTLRNEIMNIYMEHKQEISLVEWNYVHSLFYSTEESDSDSVQ